MIGLNGLGIFHRGTERSGGFLAWRTIDLDISHYMSTAISREDLEKYKESYDDESLPFDPNVRD